ncbi:MAG: diguanylate cyclase [Lachnospiraceae bacterium]|nr:diguanylate cyclase [Lachnospiraceae bacterium]
MPITVTVGISSYAPGKTTNDMMEDADSKLYYGKRNGKNQVVG